MNQQDILEIIKLLINATKNQDWNDVDQAIEYLRDYQEDPYYEE